MYIAASSPELIARILCLVTTIDETDCCCIGRPKRLVEHACSVVTSDFGTNTMSTSFTTLGGRTNQPDVSALPPPSSLGGRFSRLQKEQRMVEINSGRLRFILSRVFREPRLEGKPLHTGGSCCRSQCKRLGMTLILLHFNKLCDSETWTGMVANIFSDDIINLMQRRSIWQSVTWPR